MSNKHAPSAALVALVLLATICGGCAPRSDRSQSRSAQSTSQPRRFSLGQLQADFRQLQEIIESKHPRLYVQPEELSALFDDRYRLLSDGMDELAFYRVLTPIVVGLGCGHTALRVSGEYESYLQRNARYLPLAVRVIDDRIYVYRDLSSAGIPPGAEILSINGKSAGDIVSTLLANIAAEGANTTRKYYVMNHGFGGAYYYYVESTDSYAIVYRSPGKSGNLSLTVPGIGNEAVVMSVIGFLYSEANPGNLYSGRIADDYAVLTVRSFSPAGRKEYNTFVDGFFRELQQRNVPNLVLDLRGNWGGPPGPAMRLYSYLIDEPSRYFGGELPFYLLHLKRPVEPEEDRFSGKLYTLIDGAGFSTTGHLISLLRYHGIATFIGEESGSSWICSDGSRDFTMKHTGIRLHCATRVFQTAVSGLPMGRGVLPDYEVTPTLQDQLDGRDVVLERTAELMTGL